VENGLRAALRRRVLGVLVDEKLTVTRHCVLAGQKASCILS